MILIKTPCINTWSSEESVAIGTLASKYDLEFLDFNYLPLIDEIGYNHAFDSTDGTHLNYYGAEKLTAWIGEYLINQGYSTDIRANEDYKDMRKEYKDYPSILWRVDIILLSK